MVAFLGMDFIYICWKHPDLSFGRLLVRVVKGE
jgi:hypothetical protein